MYSDVLKKILQISTIFNKLLQQVVVRASSRSQLYKRFHRRNSLAEEYQTTCVRVIQETTADWHLQWDLFANFNRCIFSRWWIESRVISIVISRLFCRGRR